MSEIVGALLKGLAMILDLAVVLGVAYAVGGTNNTAKHAGEIGSLTSSVSGIYNLQNSFASVK